MSGAETAAPALQRRPGARRVKPLAYEGASVARLAATPSVPTPRKKDATQSNWGKIRAHSEQRINVLRSWRQSWIMNYQLLETYILPRRGIFINSAMPTPNSMIRGAPINQAIVDPTGTYAMRRCAAGIMSNEMSPSRQWFKLKPALFPREKADPDAVQWFEEVETRIDTVMSRSNFYQEAAQMFEDLVTFGTAPMIIYEDDQDLIRCYTPCCGEYFVASSSANRVETMARQFVMTVSAIVEMFGLENCPPEVQQLWRDKGGALEIEKLVAHIIEPNSEIMAPGMPDGAGVVPGGFTWREAYWIWGASSEWPLSLAGFHDQPHLVPRWAVTSNDAYGRSVGMDVMPDILQAQVETARKGEAIDKQVRPPMGADVALRNEPNSIQPGHVTFMNTQNAGAGAKGFWPLFEVRPNLTDMNADLLRVQSMNGIMAGHNVFSEKGKEIVGMISSIRL